VSAERSREWRLVARPRGEPADADFELAEVDVPEPADGQLVIRNAWISVDPYMRPRMNDAKSYVPPYRLGEPMLGGAAGRVVSSRNDRFPEGAWVSHGLGWREWSVSDGRGVAVVDPSRAPLQAYLGALGMPGLTAFVGIDDIGAVREGETVFVSAAAGAVGSAAAQIARIRGARVIGSAGSAAKVAWLEELGLDAAFDYKQAPVRDALRELAPDGIDVYFDNVGGEHLEAAISSLNSFGRVVACGSISVYNATEAPTAPRNLHQVVTKRLRYQGFIVMDHWDRMPAFHGEAADWVADGRLRWRETVVDGIEHALDAFRGLLHGDNVGKMLVRVGPGPND
jgi:NADPH-dependent curcumin reductase CurA